MSPLGIAWRLVQARGLHHAITALVLALGLGLMLATAAVGEATREAVSAMAERYPLVVGPRVGAVPLVLGSLTGLVDLEAAVPWAEVEDLERDPRVEVAVPLLTGHAVQGHPLLATSPSLLQPRSSFPLSDGRLFEAEASDEVLLGAGAAATLGLGVGDRVTIEHAHLDAPEDPGELRVVGVLAPGSGPFDDSLICPLAAIHRSHAGHDPARSSDHEHDHDHEHEHEHEHDHDHDHEQEHEHDHAALPQVSSVLIRPTDRAALLSLQESLQTRDLEVALSGQTLRRVVDRLAGGSRLLRLLVGGVVLITFLSLLISVYGASLAQARDIAALRVMGARRLEVLGIVAMATALVVIAGIGGSLVVGSTLAGVAEAVLRDELGLEISVSLLGGQAEAYLAAGLVILVAVGIQPALAAYHLQVAEALGAQAGSGLASRSFLRWSLRFLIPLAIFVWAEQMVAQHGTEGFSRPLDAESTALFDAHRGWTTGAAPPELASLDGTEQRIEGYMYALGDPWETEEFYLVALNPRLPRCPFCYRAPTRHERILVQSPGTPREVAPGLVRISGRLTLLPEGRDQIVVALDTMEVVVEP